MTEAGKDLYQGLLGKVYRDGTNNRSYLLHPPTGDLTLSTAPDLMREKELSDARFSSCLGKTTNLNFYVKLFDF